MPSNDTYTTALNAIQSGTQYSDLTSDQQTAVDNMKGEQSTRGNRTREALGDESGGRKTIFG